MVGTGHRLVPLLPVLGLIDRYHIHQPATMPGCFGRNAGRITAVWSYLGYGMQRRKMASDIRFAGEVTIEPPLSDRVADSPRRSGVGSSLVFAIARGEGDPRTLFNLLGATYLTLLLSAPGEGKGEPVFETSQRKRWREWMLRMPPSKS